MVSRRAAKSKGSQFEYDCQYSLEQKYDSVTRTAERGYQRQYDLKVMVRENTYDYYAIECKRLKGISWNQLKKFYNKLTRSTPHAKYCYVIFQSNFQPCLVYYFCPGIGYTIRQFLDVFGVPFVKHPSTRVKKQKV